MRPLVCLKTSTWTTHDGTKLETSGDIGIAAMLNSPLRYLALLCCLAKPKIPGDSGIAAMLNPPPRYLAFLRISWLVIAEPD